MIPRSVVHKLVSEIFEEVALVIGGLIAIHQVEDEMVWRLMRNIDVLRDKAMSRIDNRSDKEKVSDNSNLKPHPAIEEFLSKNREA